jgi:hypothetical protein
MVKKIIQKEMLDLITSSEIDIEKSTIFDKSGHKLDTIVGLNTIAQLVLAKCQDICSDDEFDSPYRCAYRMGILLEDDNDYSDEHDDDDDDDD